jgi:XTP/dITP diphosphohydrolase
MATLQQLVFASGNAGKARELQAMLGDSIQLILQGELGIESIEETGATFAANALLKAQHAARESGLPALGDDSGLEVDCLNGAPGIYSARYAGEDASDQDNLKKLLLELEGVVEAKRGARFRCVLALAQSADDPQPLVAEGCWEGRIAQQPSGDGGFGYDPVFIDAETGDISAELTPTEKNRRSHRGRAVAALSKALRDAGMLPVAI